MIHNLLIIVFFALWTVLFIVLILIGYFLEKKYKLAAITPQVKSQTPQNSVIFVNHMLISNVQKQSQQKNDSQLVDELINNQRMFSQQNNQENGIKIQDESAQKETSLKLPITKKQKQTTPQTIFSRKQIAGNMEGVETVQSTNRKSVRSRQSGNNSERNSIFGETPDQKVLNQPKIPSISNFQTSGYSITVQNCNVPKPAKDYYKCNLFAKIFYSHKIGLSRIFMLAQIYFRQMVCFEICGVLLLFVSQLQYYYIMASSSGGYLIIKIHDYYTIQSICKNGSGCYIKLINYVIWGSALAVLIIGIMYYEINNFICLQYYAPALALELFVVDPIRYLLIKNCLAEPRLGINKKCQSIK
ncbi:unnamed protein product (macronuclear) [Paramecium tetraurelia]|uniref:Transmembrane protein n=1 Tax=Paramecium tetraurelia TaxID=5888 RepID=A0DRL3_PARTE|nr:uncharacterized protein GSPATT00019398001 [Paramecium tetraurelia]CAK85680.1 unnamed protein product [Paramecium tetraurelia]|eukprot:XP_001453077.1 hypothetical protein (macronuclear) [Paramecium tetraurelia strain d4-2]